MKRYRRKYFKFCTVVLAAATAFVVTGCGSFGMQTYQSTDVAMGTVVTQTIYAPGGEEQGEGITGDILRLLRDLEQEKLSWRIGKSELAQMNESAGQETGYGLSEDMEKYLSEILAVARDSGGAFDPTIGKVTKLWNIDGWTVDGQGEIPPQEELQALLEHTGYEKVDIRDHRLYMEADTALDLGAAGKGIASDEIAALLKEESKVSGAVISVGGSILTYGQKPDGTPWQIGITDPQNPGSSLGMLRLEGTWCVSTSGDYERYVEIDGVRYHHILDPATGYPADSGIRGVTVLSKSGILSDILSTACFVAGRDKALELAQRYEAELLLVTEGGGIVMTEGMKACFTPLE